MNISRTLFGWSSPHIQPLTPVSEVSEPPEWPSPYLDTGSDLGEQVHQDSPTEEIDDFDATLPPTVPFMKLFVYADALDWILMSLGSLAAAVHGSALPIFVLYVGKVINLFELYNQDLHLNPKHHISPSSHHNLADEVTKHAIHIVYIAAAVFAAGWVEVGCWLYTAERQTAVLRSRGVQILLQKDLGYFDNFAGNGDFVSQISNDVLSVHDILSNKVDNYIHNMATCIASVTVGFITCWSVALVTLCTTPFILAAGIVSNIFLTRFAEHVQETYSEAALIAEQAITHIKTVYAYTNETFVKYAYANALQSTLQFGVQISLVQGLGLGCIYGIAMCSCALQMWLGWFLIVHHKANGGQILVALFAIILGGLGLNKAATNFQAFDHGRAAALRLSEILNSNVPSSSDAAASGMLILSEVQGNIELRNVYFSYPSRPDVPVLSGLYLTLSARKTLALAGSNGSGKSSIIALIERFYDPTLGEVLLDGENVKNLNVEWLRSQIGLVSQEPALFNGSVKDNILYGRNATTDDIEEAAKIAQAHTFISSLSDGYDSKIGEDSLLFTAEKKLRIAIARAVLKNPRILLLDEATSTLDMEAEQSIQEALEILMLGRSTIVIAHRLVSVRGADLIAVLEEGQLVEMGTHEELLKVDGAYAELIRLQDTVKQPRRPPPKLFVPQQVSISPNYSKPSSPRTTKSSLSNQEKSVRESQRSENTVESPPVPVSRYAERRPENANELQLQEMKDTSVLKERDNFDNTYLKRLPRLDVHYQSQKSQHSTSNPSTPESPISPLLNSDQEERSHSKTFSRSLSQNYDLDVTPTYESEIVNTPSLWRLARLSKPEWFCALLGSIGACVLGSFNPLFALLLVQVAETFYYANNKIMWHEQSKWCILVAAMGLATVVLNFLQHFYFGIMGEKMTERIRRLMFSAILRNEVGWFDKEENSPELLSMRLANDATYVKATFSNRLSVFIQQLSSTWVALVVALLMQWRIGLIAFATVPLLATACITQHMWNSGFSGDTRETHQNARRVLEEAVSNMHIVMSFSSGQKVLHLYSQQLKQPLRRSLGRGQVCGIAFGASQFLLYICNAFLLWYGSSIVKRQSRTSFPNIIKAYLVFTFTTFSLIEVYGLGPSVLKRRKSIAPVFDIINRRSKMEEDNIGHKPSHSNGHIEFQDVEFRYPTQPEIPVLTKFNLQVEPGKTVALVGTASSGKSTVVSLLNRFYEPLGGKIMLDGNDIRTLNLHWLRRHVATVQQDTVLFSASVRENIILGRHNATDAEITEASRVANAHHFISSLPHGYNTHVNMTGLHLTPSQRLRITIARAVLKNAPILILDEPTSNLEPESIRVVQDALEHIITGNRTTLVVAHRLALLRRVNLVAMLHDGQILAEGTHDELMNRCGAYARMMQPQFSSRSSKLHHSTS